MSIKVLSKYISYCINNNIEPTKEGLYSYKIKSEECR
jgi:hypothetical protein